MVAAGATAEVDEFREALDRALRELDADERAGPLLRAANLHLKIVLADVGLVVRIDAEREGEANLRWSFADSEDPARLELRMDSDTANAYLQGKESLPIAIARGRVRVAGSSRVALIYLPALALICDPYRRQVRERFPRLSLA